MLDPAAFAAPASPINTSHCQTTIRWRKAHTTDRASGIRPQPKAMHRVSTLGNANRLSGPSPRAGRILVHISVSIGRRAEQATPSPACTIRADCLRSLVYEPLFEYYTCWFLLPSRVYGLCPSTCLHTLL